MENSSLIATLQTNSWVATKRNLGEEVLRFHEDNADYQSDFPIFIRKKFGIRIGWVPYGISYSGDAPSLIKDLKIFLRTNKLMFILSNSYPYMTGNYLNRILHKVPYLKPEYTVTLNLTHLNESTLPSKFNQTTRKHIRRGFKEGVQILPMQSSDLSEFWQFYLSTCQRNNFKPVCSFNFLKTLRSNLSKTSGLELIGLKSVRASKTTGYLIAMATNLHLLEFLRANNPEIGVKGYDAKILTCSMIEEALKKSVQTYDFGGIDPKYGKGIMAYKMGFGGEICKSDPIAVLSCI